ncbi:UNVERIFIED_CONTAM: putative galacturonosyltransferase 11 [Sesamum calycinum]|uniref:Hexosyltransferase n=1 Tax=Sesamum calycinum TaxID=2727403 RepID=A0AAW2PP00_9LAMI
MALAKAYVIIAKEHNNLHLAWELSSKIRSCQFLLSKAAMREEPISLDEAEPIIESLAALIFKAQDAHYDIATTMITLKNFIQSLEDRANAATVQSTVFGQLVAESLPKNLQCIDIKLTADWLQSKSIQELAKDRRNSPRLVDNNLYHSLVFHVVTNGVKYGAMQAWFLSNDFKGATLEVKNIEDFSWLNASYSPVVKQLQDTDSRRFYFEVETCLEAFHRYYKYLNFSNPLISTKVDPQACGWAFGMNVFDLIAWRKANVTTRYHYWQEKNTDKSLWKLGTLPPGLLAFYGLTEPLDRRWHVLGLGYDLNIDNRLIETAAVIHFNGNMKPWLKLSIGRYRPLWEQYVNQTHRYLQDCTTS